MAPSYSTIPAAAVEAETPLLQRDIKINAKTLVGGAAAAAFAFGALAATAVSSAPQPTPAALYTAPRAPAALYSAAGDYQPGWNNIELSSDHTMCLVGSGKGVPLSVEKCSPHFGAFSQVPNDDGTVTLQSQGLCLTGLRDGSVDFATGQPFGLFTCDPAYADFQNFQVSGSYKTDLMLPSSNLCVSAEGANVVAAPCADIPAQNFRFVQSSPPTKPPTPKPAPKPHPKPTHKPTHKPKVGTNSDQDKHHNCCGNGGECGYHWCKYSNSCKRYGECSKNDTPVIGADVDKHGCHPAWGEHWNGKECAGPN